MTIEFWSVYCATIFVASILPGPSMLLALTNGMRYGLRLSLMTAAGNTAASSLQAAIAITGLGAILFASEWVFQIIKWGGAAYLVYIGLMMWRHQLPSPDAAAQQDRTGSGSGWKQFGQGFMVAMGNPKAVVFFTALFPQFIQPGNSGPLVYAEMILTLALIAFICMMIYALGGRRIAGLFRRSLIRKWVSRTIGGLFMGGGLGLALSDR